MSPDDFIKIHINGQPVGVVGLNKTLQDMAEHDAQRPDDEIRTELVKRLSRHNYIPDRAKEAYGKALLREFNKFLGRPVDEDVSEGLEIKVLGPGCARCDRLEREVMEVAAEMNLPAAVDHVRDIKEIASYGVMGTPALVINGKVVSVGTVPSKEKIKEWLGAVT
jgi:small redox-active disulfide protein 2